MWSRLHERDLQRWASNLLLCLSILEINFYSTLLTWSVRPLETITVYQMLRKPPAHIFIWMWNALWICMSSLCRGHDILLFPILLHVWPKQALTLLNFYLNYWNWCLIIPSLSFFSFQSTNVAYQQLSNFSIIIITIIAVFLKYL